MAYPTIMRERAIEALNKGYSKKEVNEMLGLDKNVLKEWEKLQEETGSLEKRPLNRKPIKIDREQLSEYCKENPFATHVEAALHFSCSETGIRHAKKALGITRKKKTTRYSERDEQEREDFSEIIENLDEDVDIYYADESGFDEYYSRSHGYSHHSERVFGDVPGTHFERTSVISAQLNNDLVAPFAFKGYMNGDLFEGWLESIFVPSLRDPAKSILIIDNAAHHRKNAIAVIAEEYNFRVIYLPKYSPDLNPIEKKWANVKNWLRQHMHKFVTFWDAFIPAFR